MDDMETTRELPAIGSERNGDGDGGSFLAELRAMRERMVEEAAPRLELEVPNNAGRIWAVYQFPPEGYQKVTAAMEGSRRGKDPDALLNNASDLLLACCASIVGRRAGRRVDLLTDRFLGDELPDPPLRINRQLGEALQIELPSDVSHVNRYILRHLFSPRAQATGEYAGDMAIIDQADDVLAWLSGRDQQLARDFSGE